MRGSRDMRSAVWTQFLANLISLWPMWCKWANDHDSAQRQASTIPQKFKQRKFVKQLQRYRFRKSGRRPPGQNVTTIPLRPKGGGVNTPPARRAEGLKSEHIEIHHKMGTSRFLIVIHYEMCAVIFIIVGDMRLKQIVEIHHKMGVMRFIIKQVLWSSFYASSDSLSSGITIPKSYILWCNCSQK